MKEVGYYNGVMGPLAEMTVPMGDRALYFGDGIYEATCVANRVPFALDDHLDRMYNSLRLMEIPFTMERDQVKAERFNHIMGGAFSAVADIDSGAASNPSDRPNMFGWVSLVDYGTDVAFDTAVRMAQTILSAAWDRAREWADTLAEARQALTWDGTPPVLDVERRGMKEALHTLGCEAPFFVSPHGSEWAVVQTCPKDQPFNPFGSSRVLPKAWAGLRGEALQKVSGYKSATFAFAPGGGDTVMAFFGDKADAVAAAEAACK